MSLVRLSFHHLVVLCFLILSVSLRADTNGTNSLSREIEASLSKVTEFKFIQEKARELGVRVWLFGGTAAAYAHYVSQDLARQRGDNRYQDERFRYKYLDIFRSNQDLDLVVDGPPEAALRLQALLESTYPHLQGSKTAWEVRLLRQNFGDKEALLNNKDFSSQHTDSHSTGMIELTGENTTLEPRVRDLRDWDSKAPHFLKDVRDRKLHLYYSDAHSETSRARQGMNPPILFAIRALTKAFQYELELRPEDWALLKRVIDDFDPARDTQNPYVARWIEKNGKKLLQNAVEIEQAHKTLRDIGLADKLVRIKNDTSKEDSLAWWMKREPLKSYPIVNSAGKTAKELGLSSVAHETKSFLAYEAITRSRKGIPNVFISRQNATGETAAYGNGFYTREGRTGLGTTGITIRFKVNPDAVEGRDFLRISQEGSGGDYILFLNRNALEVIPESLNLSPVQFFELLNSGEISKSDQGILERLRLEVGYQSHTLTDAEYRRIIEIVKQSLELTPGRPNQPLIEAWLRLQRSPEFTPNLGRDLFSKRAGQVEFLMNAVVDFPHWRDKMPRISLLDFFKHLADRAVLKETEQAKLLRYFELFPPTDAEYRATVHFLEKERPATGKRALNVMSFFTALPKSPQFGTDWLKSHILNPKYPFASMGGSTMFNHPHWNRHPIWNEIHSPYQYFLGIRHGGLPTSENLRLFRQKVLGPNLDGAPMTHEEWRKAFEVLGTLSPSSHNFGETLKNWLDLPKSFDYAEPELEKLYANPYERANLAAAFIFSRKWREHPFALRLMELRKELDKLSESDGQSLQTKVSEVLLRRPDFVKEALPYILEKFPHHISSRFLFDFAIPKLGLDAVSELPSTAAAKLFLQPFREAAGPRRLGRLITEIAASKKPNAHEFTMHFADFLSTDSSRSNEIFLENLDLITKMNFHDQGLFSLGQFFETLDSLIANDTTPRRDRLLEVERELIRRVKTEPHEKHWDNFLSWLAEHGSERTQLYLIEILESQQFPKQAIFAERFTTRLLKSASPQVVSRFKQLLSYPHAQGWNEARRNFTLFEAKALPRQALPSVCPYDALAKK